jgi:hypothetical protein
MVTWTVFISHLLEVGLTKLEDYGTLNARNHCLILFYHVWGHAWIQIHWNSIWLRARSHMISHYTWGSVTTLHDFGGVFGWPLDTFFWALTISWLQLNGSCVKWHLRGSQWRSQQIWPWARSHLHQGDNTWSHWFPTRKSSHASSDKKTGQWRRHGRKGAQPNEDKT